MDENGNTALHIACIRRDVKSIEMLLNYGADLGLKNIEGKTPEEMLNMSFVEAKKIIARQTDDVDGFQGCYTLKENNFENPERDSIYKLLNSAQEHKKKPTIKQ
jgi:hypothetical protein